MFYIDEKELAALKAKYPAGSSVKLTATEDGSNISHLVGKTGKVLTVDDSGRILVQWSNGEKTYVLYNVDTYEPVSGRFVQPEQKMIAFDCYKIVTKNLSWLNPTVRKEFVQRTMAVSAKQAVNNVKYNLGYPAKFPEKNGEVITFEAVPAILSA